MFRLRFTPAKQVIMLLKLQTKQNAACKNLRCFNVCFRQNQKNKWRFKNYLEKEFYPERISALKNIRKFEFAKLSEFHIYYKSDDSSYMYIL